MNAINIKNIKNDQMVIYPLGAGLEVGRSCIIMEYKGKTVMFDCGLHMGKTGHASLPCFDYIKPDQIDIIFITHFHLDHCAALPYFITKTDFDKKKQKVYATSPTRQIYRHVLKDSLTDKSENIKLYTVEDIEESLEAINVIDFQEEMEHNNIKFKCYPAGHVLGAAMFLVEIDGVRVLYTGDYSTEKDILIPPARIYNEKFDVLIVEGTYGICNHESRSERENQFTQEVMRIVKNNGQCLLPVFALGRAQEIVLILEEFWKQNSSELADIKIHFTSQLSQKANTIFQHYKQMMSDPVKNNQINPFNLQYAPNNLSLQDDIAKEEKACVILSSPFNLQSGISRKIIERICHKPENGVILTGFCPENTLSKDIQIERQQKTIKSIATGKDIPFNMSVMNISFSAHADLNQTINFIKEIEPRHVILVHGNQKNIQDLQKELTKRFESLQVYAPDLKQKIFLNVNASESCKLVGDLEKELRNDINKYVQEIENNIQIDNQIEENEKEDSLEHEPSLMQIESEIDPVPKDKAKVTGEAEEVAPEQKTNTQSYPSKTVSIEGVMIADEDNILMMKSQDVAKYKAIKQVHVQQSMQFPYMGTLNLAKFFSKQLFFPGTIVSDEEGKEYLRIEGGIRIYVDQIKKNANIKWTSSERNDIIADIFGDFLSQIQHPYDDIFSDQHQDDSNVLKTVLKEFPDSLVKLDEGMIIMMKDDLPIGTIDLEVKEVKTSLRNKDIEDKYQALLNQLKKN